MAGPQSSVLTLATEAAPDCVPLWVLHSGTSARLQGDIPQAEQAYRAAIERKADVAAYRGLFAVLAGPGGNPAGNPER